MKKIFGALIVFLLFTSFVFPQTTTDNAVGKVLQGKNYIYWNPGNDSTETSYSQAFTFAGHETVQSNGNVLIAYYADLPTVTGGKGYATIITHLTSFDNSTWTTVDTLANLTSGTASTGTYNLNQKPAPYHKLKAVNTKATNPLTVYIYLPK